MSEYDDFTLILSNEIYGFIVLDNEEDFDDFHNIDEFICKKDPKIGFNEISTEYSSCRCNYAFNSDSFAFRCKDCETNDSSCLCIKCFDLNKHKGHKYYIYKCSSGGCCDCGDESSWDPKTWCDKHKIKTDLKPFEKEYIYNII